jgi:serine/threonine-protein kinase
MALSWQGLYGEGLAELQTAIDLAEGPQTVFLAEKALVYGLMGQRDSATAVLSELMEMSEQGETYVAPDLIALAHIGLGQHEEAMDWLEKAWDEREQGLIHLKMSPWYDPLRSHPRFQALMEKMDFPEG